jgi:hypothetical protein
VRVGLFKEAGQPETCGCLVRVAFQLLPGSLGAWTHASNGGWLSRLRICWVDGGLKMRVNLRIMATEFATALGLLKTITSTTKGLLNAREEAKVNDVAIYLQGIVLDLQSEMMMIQSDYQNVLRSRDELEKKLVEQEAWDKERARYHLEQGKGLWANFVYALNVKNPAVEPAHWLCAHCYEDKKKSILQARPENKWHCPRCNATILMTGFPQ